MQFAAPLPWDRIRRDVAKSGRRPVTAVIAYIGSDAPKLLPLANGDTLVCDASEAVRAGMTSAAALQTFARKRVAIFSIEGLHAKIVLGSRWAWVGSANASASSRDALWEASVRVTDTRTVSQVRTWAGSLCTSDAELARREVDALAQLPVKRRTGLPRRRTLPSHLPSANEVLWIMDTTSDASHAAETAAERERAWVRNSQTRPVGSTLSWIEWDDANCPVSPGEWVIELRSGHPRRPAQVVHVSQPTARRCIIWLATVPSPNRPRLKDLLASSAITRQQLDASESAARVIPRHRQGVIDLYR